MDYSQKDIDRFWSKVDKEKSTTFYGGSRCWEWIAGRASTGYGQMWIGKKNLHTHRVVYELCIGRIPENLHVLHHCDNPICCNPYHLFLGTHQDNMDDKVRKGRQVSGESQWHHKLSDAQVNEIRQRYGKPGTGGESSSLLSKIFGVHPSHIRKIARYKSRS